MHLVEVVLLKIYHRQTHSLIFTSLPVPDHHFAHSENTITVSFGRPDDKMNVALPHDISSYLGISWHDSPETDTNGFRLSVKAVNSDSIALKASQDCVPGLLLTSIRVGLSGEVVEPVGTLSLSALHDKVRT